MQKRKLKINILDVAIFVAIICSVAALIFRDTISDVFSKPEIAALEIAVVVENLPEDRVALFKEGGEVVLEPESDSAVQITAKIKSCKREASGRATVVLACSGYKRLGRYYTESGEKLTLNGPYRTVSGDSSFKSTLETVNIKS